MADKTVTTEPPVIKTASDPFCGIITQEGLTVTHTRKGIVFVAETPEEAAAKFEEFVRDTQF